MYTVIANCVLQLIIIMSEEAAAKPTPVRQHSTSSTGSDGGSEEGRTRSSSLTDTRWRTASFSEPGRIVVVAIDASENAKASFECKCEISLELLMNTNWFQLLVSTVCSGLQVWPVKE